MGSFTLAKPLWWAKTPRKPKPIAFPIKLRKRRDTFIYMKIRKTKHTTTPILGNNISRFFCDVHQNCFSVIVTLNVQAFESFPSLAPYCCPATDLYLRLK